MVVEKSDALLILMLRAKPSFSSLSLYDFSFVLSDLKFHNNVSSCANSIHFVQYLVGVFKLKTCNLFQRHLLE